MVAGRRSRRTDDARTGPVPDTLTTQPFGEDNDLLARCGFTIGARGGKPIER
jgi:hypothetical protein